MGSLKIYGEYATFNLKIIEVTSMKKMLLVAVFSFFIGLLVAGMLLVYLPERNDTGFAQNEQRSFSSSQLFASPLQEINTRIDFSKIIEKVGPAVVKITSERVEKRQVSSGFGDEFFDDFWDRFFGVPKEQEYRSVAQGTGFFISSGLPCSKHFPRPPPFLPKEICG